MKKSLMKIAAGLAVTAAFSGHAVADLRSKGPRGTAQSAKTVEQLAGCAALKMAAWRGYEIRDNGAPNPRELMLVSRIVGVAAVVGVVSIADLGDQRQISIFSTGKASGAPAVITAAALSCAEATPARPQ